MGVTPGLASRPTDPAFPERRRDGVRFFRTYQPRYTRDQDRDVRRTVQEPGTIRRLWQNLAAYTGAAPPFSWTDNDFDGTAQPPRAHVSTPLRYLVTTVNTLTAGNQRSAPMRRPQVPPTVAHGAPALVMAGNVGYRPTVRSRIPSFGSRVPALNQGFGIAGTE